MRATPTAIAAGLAAAGSSLDRRSAVVRAIAAMQFDEQRTRNCSNPGTGSELRISDAAAQTRIVSGGAVGRAKVSLSRDLNYMAGARIPEFESYHPSQAVRSPPANMRMDHIASRMKLPRFHGFSQATMRSLGKDAPNGRPIERFGKHTQSWMGGLHHRYARISFSEGKHVDGFCWPFVQRRRPNINLTETSSANVKAPEPQKAPRI